MARLPRLTVPGYAHHLIQRGNNRQAIFASDADRQFLIDLLTEHARQCEVAVHAYVLMDNHFHLLATPATAQGLAQMMQAVGRRYVRYFNDAQARSGTLWEGRYKSALVQPNPYLLACMVYMDLHPVRSGLVAQAQDYPWSSHGHYAGLRSENMLSAHPLLWELGNTPFAREDSYRLLVQSGLGVREEQAIRQSAIGSWALGEQDFITGIQKDVGRRLSKLRPGRPALPQRDTVGVA